MLPIVERSEWGGREPKLVETFDGPIPFVIIHHSYIPSACYSEKACESAMRKMQDMHQLQNGWNDIGYSFAVGGDGRIYRGRGYNVIGAHAPRYNDKSIGICLIGDWRSNCRDALWPAWECASGEILTLLPTQVDVCSGNLRQQFDELLSSAALHKIPEASTN